MYLVLNLPSARRKIEVGPRRQYNPKVGFGHPVWISAQTTSPSIPSCTIFGKTNSRRNFSPRRTVSKVRIARPPMLIFAVLASSCSPAFRDSWKGASVFGESNTVSHMNILFRGGWKKQKFRSCSKKRTEEGPRRRRRKC